MLTEGAPRLNRNRSRERKKWSCKGRVPKCKTGRAFRHPQLTPRNASRGHTPRPPHQALSQAASTSENGASICEPNAGCRASRARLARGLLMPQRKRASCRGEASA